MCSHGLTNSLPATKHWIPGPTCGLRNQAALAFRSQALYVVQGDMNTRSAMVPMLALILFGCTSTRDESMTTPNRVANRGACCRSLSEEQTTLVLLRMEKLKPDMTLGEAFDVLGLDATLSGSLPIVAARTTIYVFPLAHGGTLALSSDNWQESISWALECRDEARQASCARLRTLSLGTP